MLTRRHGYIAVIQVCFVDMLTVARRGHERTRQGQLTPADMSLHNRPTTRLR